MGFARWFPRKLRVKSIRQNIFARTIKGFGGEGRLLCVTGSKFDRSFCPFVNFFVSLDTSFRAHYFVAYIRRSAKRTDGRCRLCARETDLRGVFVHARKT